MPWTEITRGDHVRSDLRYASDCRDEAWKVIAPTVTQRSKVGRPRTVNMRRVWEAIQYIATTGCQWRQLPKKDFPSVSTVRYHFYRMRDDGTFTVIAELLSVASRIVEGRNGEPTAAISSTARASRRLRVAACLAMTPERRSRAASAT